MCFDRCGKWALPWCLPLGSFVLSGKAGLYRLAWAWAVRTLLHYFVLVSVYFSFFLHPYRPSTSTPPCVSVCVWHYAYCGRRLTCIWPYSFGAGEDWKRTNRNMLLPMAVLSINRAPKGGRRGRSVIRKIDQKKEIKTHRHTPMVPNAACSLASIWVCMCIYSVYLFVCMCFGQCVRVCVCVLQKPGAKNFPTKDAVCLPRGESETNRKYSHGAHP